MVSSHRRGPWTLTARVSSSAKSCPRWCPFMRKGATAALCLFVHGFEACYDVAFHRFIFGDLKPENILVTGSGHAKITDFGAVRPFVPGNHATTQLMCGRPWIFSCLLMCVCVCVVCALPWFVLFQHHRQSQEIRRSHAERGARSSRWRL